MSDEKRRAFLAFHEENPAVFDLFLRFSREARRSGHSRMSAYMIMHRVRWETAITTTERRINPDTGEPLKINNNHIPYYSRLLMEQHPEFDGFFVTRDLWS